METLTEEERQEAMSIRYVDAARIVRLASGTLVVMSMTRGDIVGTARLTEPFKLAGLINEAVVRSTEFWEAAKRAELERKKPLAEAFVEKSAKELGL